MNKTMLKTLSLVAVMIAAALMLGACGAAAPAEPTVDPNVIFTQVAETVMVSMTQTSEAMPPTATPEPTATTAPTQPPAPTADINQEQTPPQGQQAAPTISMGPTPTVQLFGDVAKWNTQSPLDGKIFKTAEEFTFHVCMQNVGSTDWTTGFYLKYIDGNKVCWNNKVNVGDTVEPGDKWCFDLGCTAPSSPGSYTTYWFMYDADGNKVTNGEVYFAYKAE